MLDKDFLDRMKVKVNRPSDNENIPPLERVRNILRSKGLEGIAEPVLKFRTLPPLENAPAVGTSKLGGNPDLPIGIHWPTWHGRPLDFLLQLDLTEIPRKFADDLLPERGWIYFFYDVENNPWGFDVSHRGGWRVFFFDGDRAALECRTRPDSTNTELKPFPLTFFESIYVNWPSIQDEKAESDLGYLEQHAHLLDAMAEISGHQILGNTHGCQRSGEDMQEQSQLVSNGIYMGGGGGPVFDHVKAAQVKPGIKDWRLLLELRSDENANLIWTAYGTLYFWIREEDLLNSEFDHVWALFQCM
jgi:uncharacterized protein YwqG